MSKFLQKLLLVCTLLLGVQFAMAQESPRVHKIMYGDDLSNYLWQNPTSATAGDTVSIPFYDEEKFDIHVYSSFGDTLQYNLKNYKISFVMPDTSVYVMGELIYHSITIDKEIVKYFGDSPSSKASSRDTVRIPFFGEGKITPQVKISEYDSIYSVVRDGELIFVMPAKDVTIVGYEIPSNKRNIHINEDILSYFGVDSADFQADILDSIRIPFFGEGKITPQVKISEYDSIYSVVRDGELLFVMPAKDVTIVGYEIPSNKRNIHINEDILSYFGVDSADFQADILDSIRIPFFGEGKITPQVKISEYDSIYSVVRDGELLFVMPAKDVTILGRYIEQDTTEVKDTTTYYTVSIDPEFGNFYMGYKNDMATAGEWIIVPFMGAQALKPIVKKDMATAYFPINYQFSGDTAIIFQMPNANVIVAGDYYQFEDSVIYGCTDPAALNYDTLATVRDNSCIYEEIVYGCTDPKALNYDANATRNSGLCEYARIVKGCTDPSAINFDTDATEEDGSCQFPDNNIYGCTDPYALNYNDKATIDNETCLYKTISDKISGCTDTVALNYNPIATTSDNSCVYADTEVNELVGCDDSRALNFNKNVTKADSSLCIYANPISTLNTKLAPQQKSWDKLAQTVEDACDLDFTAPFDSLSVKLLSIRNGKINTRWFVLQGKSRYEFDAAFDKNSDAEDVVLYLSLICNQSNSRLRSSSSMVKGASLSTTLNLKSGMTDVPAVEVVNYTIYPNPATDVLYVATNGIDQTWYIISLNGRLLQSANASAGVQSVAINVSGLNPGEYILQSEDGSVRTVFLKK